ncbi:MAG: hypothetical protein KFB96_19555 [Thiocapsa sp.]|uniref:hypothetical protein n=1 Tax=Thiocapsa sp. TaxID=2024551 RepID=UPI001BD17813|nr:hypothetical protein [Thiocapsa sp.]QVL47847.1 MAG: hypothetical protein KFB96_19555 [Thiocapsa sp.]
MKMRFARLSFFVENAQTDKSAGGSMDSFHAPLDFLTISVTKEATGMRMLRAQYDIGSVRGEITGSESSDVEGFQSCIFG